MDKVQLDSLRFLYQKDRTCKVSEIREMVDFTGSNLQFLNHLHHLSTFPKYILLEQDRLTITADGKLLLIEDEKKLARIAEKEELELDGLRNEYFNRPQKILYEKWQFYAAIIGIAGVILGLLKCT